MFLWKHVPTCAPVSAVLWEKIDCRHQNVSSLTETQIISLVWQRQLQTQLAASLHSSVDVIVAWLNKWFHVDMRQALDFDLINCDLRKDESVHIFCTFHLYWLYFSSVSAKTTGLISLSEVIDIRDVETYQMSKACDDSWAWMLELFLGCKDVRYEKCLIFQSPWWQTMLTLLWGPMVRIIACKICIINIVILRIILPQENLKVCEVCEWHSHIF